MDYAKLANALTYSNNLKKDILKNSIHLKLPLFSLFQLQPVRGGGHPTISYLY